jgi:hypothetical protein
MNDVYSQIVSQIARLAGWLARLFMHHRGELKFSLAFAFTQLAAHTKSGRRE